MLFDLSAKLLQAACVCVVCVRMPDCLTVAEEEKKV